MIEINLNTLHKSETRVSVKGHKSGKGYVKPYIRVVKGKTAAQADVEVDEKLAALQAYKEAASRTNDWIATNQDRSRDVGEVNDYTVDTYKVINTALRDEFTEEELSGMVIGDQIKSISAFLKAAPKFEGTAFRGMGFNLDNKIESAQYNKFIDEIENSDSIVLKPFTSTTQDENLARGFIGKTGEAFGSPGGIMFEIKSKSGVALDGAAEFKSEKEILFDKGLEFKVTNYYVDPYTRNYHVELEEI